jgi:hypothetical protein
MRTLSLSIGLGYLGGLGGVLFGIGRGGFVLCEVGG